MTHLERIHQAACLRRPEVQLPFPAFARAAEVTGAAIGDLEARGAEVLLAAACALGDPAAIRAFERDYLSAVPRHVARLRLREADVDEVRQTLRIRLLSGEAPRIGTYNGRAPLDAWVRVAAVRIGLDLRERAQRAPIQTEDARLAALVMTDADPELLTAKGHLREPFQRAIDAALAGLGPKEKALLRMHVVDGLNLDAIGKVLRVHRATVARWLVSVRRDLFEGVRLRLGLRRAPSSSEFRSLVRLVEGDLKVSVDRLLSA